MPITHGMAKTNAVAPEYAIWCNLKQRCLNPRSQAYPDYGGRGISVWPEWVKSFRSFFNHIGPRPTPAHTLDRLNNDDGYYPGNVAWRTQKEQARNTRQNVFVTIGGNRMVLKDAAIMNGILPVTAQWRHSFGWSAIDAVTIPPQRRRSKAELEGEK